VLGDLLRFHGVENDELLDALDWKYRRIEDERAKLRAENDRLREALVELRTVALDALNTGHWRELSIALAKEAGK
jgi:C4-dicarboxylate-specific signal transduction histidine kinase